MQTDSHARGRGTRGYVAIRHRIGIALLVAFVVLNLAVAIWDMVAPGWKPVWQADAAQLTWEERALTPPHLFLAKPVAGPLVAPLSVDGSRVHRVRVAAGSDAASVEGRPYFVGWTSDSPGAESHDLIALGPVSSLPMDLEFTLPAGVSSGSLALHVRGAPSLTGLSISVDSRPRSRMFRLYHRLSPFGFGGNPDPMQRDQGLPAAILALFFGVAINAVLLRALMLAPLPAVLAGYYFLFVEAALAGDISHYLNVSAFGVMSLLLGVLFILAVTVLLKRRVRLALPRKHAISLLGYAIWPIAFGTVIAAFSGDFMVYGADSSWYASAARQMLTIDRYYLDNLGSPYVYGQIDATASMIQAVQAYVARFSGADILAVNHVMRIAAPSLLFTTAALFFRAVGLGPVAALGVAIAFFSLSTDHLALSMLSLSRIQGHGAGLAAFAVLAVGLRTSPRSGTGSHAYLIAAAALAGALAAVHLPRMFAIGFIFAIVFPSLILASGRLTRRALARVAIGSAGVAGAILAIAVGPKVPAILSIYSNHNTALPEYQGESIQGIIALHPYLVWPSLLAGVVWASHRFRRWSLFGSAQLARRVELAAGFLLVFGLARWSLNLMYATVPLLPLRNYSEIAVFMETMIPALALALTALLLPGLRRLRAIGRRRPGKLGVASAIAFVCIGTVLVGLHYAKMIPIQRTRAAHWGTRFAKTNKNWDASRLRPVIDELEVLREPPRVAGSPDSVMLLSAFVPAKAVAFGLRSPAFSQATTMGYFPALESFFSANAPDRWSALTWAKHLDVAYRLTEIRSGKGVAEEGTLWSSAPDLYLSQSRDNTFAKMPLAGPGDCSRTLKSLLGRFRLATVDHTRGRSPVIEFIRLGTESVELWPTGRAPLQSFVYTLPAPFRNWGDRAPSGAGRQLSVRILKEKVRYRVPEYPFRVSSTEPLARRMEVGISADRDVTLSMDIWAGARWRQVLKQVVARTNGASVTLDVPIAPAILSDAEHEFTQFFPCTPVVP
jgi:hypothetical protein